MADQIFILNDARLTTNLVDQDTITGFEKVNLSGGFGDDIIIAQSYFDLVADDPGGAVSAQVFLDSGQGDNFLQLGNIAHGWATGGGDGADTLIGGEENSTFHLSGGGADFISTGGGADSIIIFPHEALNGFAVTPTTIADFSDEDVITIIAAPALTGANLSVVADAVGTTLEIDFELDGDPELIINLLGTYSGNFLLVDGQYDGQMDLRFIGAFEQHGFAGGYFADFLVGSGAADQMWGYYGDDTLDGGGGGDVIFGAAGNDSLDGGNGNDTLTGGAGGDTLNGGKGYDYLTAEAGHDLLAGDDHSDTLWGGDGNDTLNGGADNDRLYGDAQRDLIFGDSGDDIIDAGTGNDTVDGGGQRDSVFGGSGFDLIDGGNGNDTLTGGTDGDTLNGGAGFDILQGDAGDDVLNGGASNDIIFGNAGNDTIIFELGGGTDTLRDFTSGAASEDVINLVGFGAAFDTFAEVIGAATQTGNHVTIDFGNGDMLIIRNTLIASLHADDFTFG